MTWPAIMQLLAKITLMADVAIVRDMSTGHQQVIVAEDRQVPLFHGAMNRHVLANRVAGPDDHAPGRSGMRTCCGIPPMTAPSKTWLLSPSVVPCFDDDVRFEDAVVADRDVGLDDREGADRDVLPQFCGRVDDGKRVDLHLCEPRQGGGVE